MFKPTIMTYLILVAVLLLGCSSSTLTPVQSLTKASTSTSTPIPEENSELASYFQGFTGAFVFYDQNSNQTLRYNPDRCAERVLPASTFKILNALIGLETGVIPDESYVIKWDGTQYPNASWNQDHTLKTAMQNSIV